MDRNSLTEQEAILSPFMSKRVCTEAETKKYRIDFCAAPKKLLIWNCLGIGYEKNWIPNVEQGESGAGGRDFEYWNASGASTFESLTAIPS